MARDLTADADADAAAAELRAVAEERRAAKSGALGGVRALSAVECAAGGYSI